MRELLLAAEKVRALAWSGDALHLLDQRSLPFEEVWLVLGSAEAVILAIEVGVAEGAAILGVCAAFGLVLAARERARVDGDWRVALESDRRRLAAVAPVAAWALQRMDDRLQRLRPGEEALWVLEMEAQGIHQSVRDTNMTMAQHGVELIRQQQGNVQNLLTHGSAGALATGGFGTALGVIRGAYLEGLVERVYVDESRPSLVGARLAAWELAREGVPVSLAVDGAAAHVMKTRGVTWVVVGAERIAANGDVVGVVGTYQLSVSAMHHGVRFMVVAPSSIIDPALESGDDLSLPEGEASLLAPGGRGLLAGVGAVNPALDVTPADLVDFIVTERGVVERPDAGKLAQLINRKRLH